MNPTVQQIADALGYAKSTVSMALRDNPTVNAKTRQRIQQAAREMNYQPNALAQAIYTGKAKVIGFATHTIASEYLSTFMDGMIEQAQEQGYLVKIIRIAWEFDARELASQCQAQCLSGLVCGEANDKSIRNLIDLTVALNLPVSQIAGPPELPGLMSIRCDDHTGILQAIEHLAQLGHRHIGFIGGHPHSISSQVREAGFRKALHAVGLKNKPEDYVCGEYEIEPTQQATRTLLGRPNRPTAIFCANDPMAMTAISTARHMGIHTPRDLSVVGCSDLQMAQYCDPPLTSIHQPQQQMGRLAIKRLINVIDCIGQKRSIPVTHEPPLPTQLVIRQSTGPVAGK
jgi:DNA-binding LacI/PurR family transcriptional regulator